MRDCFPLQRGLNFHDIRICFKLFGEESEKEEPELHDSVIYNTILSIWKRGKPLEVSSPKEGRELSVNPQVSSTLVQGMMHAVSHAHSIFPEGQSCADRRTFFFLLQTHVRQVCGFGCAAATLY